MNGSEHPSRLGRFAALATLAASAALFLTALTGIASIDPGASATGSAAPVPATHGVSLDQKGQRSEKWRDCPWRHGRRDAAKRDFTS